MAGSFDVFRKYQRSMMVVVAILAMLAFFVLPPIIDAFQTRGGADPLVATWRGGGIRERELWRAGAMRQAMLQFLEATFLESGRDARSQPLNDEEDYVLGRLSRQDEEDIVRTLLLAREAQASGIVVGNDAVNRFLRRWTVNRIRPERLDRLVSSLRIGGTSVSADEVFETLRQILTAQKMVRLFASGLSGDPPGVAWDNFRRFEQEATVEVVAVPVESFAAETRAPTEADLRGLFERFKDRLPDEWGSDPGFMEPHRVSYDWVAAVPADLEAAAAKEVTEDQIAAFYEENKAVFYRLQPATPAAPEKAPEPPAGVDPPPDPAAKSEPTGASPETPPQPAETTDEPAPDGSAPAEPKASVPVPRRFVPVRFRQTDKEPTAEPAAVPGSPAAPASPEKSPAEPAAEFQPLDEVRDDIRRRLARQAVEARLPKVFAEISVEVADFSVRQTQQPNVDALAAREGFKAGRGEKLTAAEAMRAGGVGESYAEPDRFAPGRSDSWAAQIFQAPTWLTIETQTDAGDRYLSWKTADFPAFVPDFAAKRADVEKAWRMREARSRAEEVAKEIAAGAVGGRTLAEVAGGRSGAPLEARTVGPFTWLSKFLSISQPEGLVMPGEDVMQAVFGLEPGGTTVAFNEPRTICYAIRLVSFTPAEEDLRRRFIDPASDRRRMGDLVAESRQRQAFGAWFSGIEKRAGLEWKRPAEQR